MSHELVVSSENTLAIILAGRAGAVEADFNVFNERYVSGVLTSTNINADTSIAESTQAAGLFYLSWTPTAEQLGGAVVLKHVASGDSAAESILISKSRTRIRNCEAAVYPTIDSFDGTLRTIKDPDNSASTFATYTRSTSGSTVTWTR